eukprot:1489008-Prorocentrum_lima.AAC.1
MNCNCGSLLSSCLFFVCHVLPGVAARMKLLVAGGRAKMKLLAVEPNVAGHAPPLWLLPHVSPANA